MDADVVDENSWMKKSGRSWGRLSLSTRNRRPHVEITELRSSELGPIRSENLTVLFCSLKRLAPSASAVMPRSTPVSGKYKLIATPTSIFFSFLSLHLRQHQPTSINTKFTYIHQPCSYTLRLSRLKPQFQPKCLPKPQQRRSPPLRPPPVRPPLRRRKLERRPLPPARRRSAPRRARKPTLHTSIKVYSHFRFQVAFLMYLSRSQHCDTNLNRLQFLSIGFESRLMCWSR